MSITKPSLSSITVSDVHEYVGSFMEQLQALGLNENEIDWDGQPLSTDLSTRKRNDRGSSVWLFFRAVPEQKDRDGCILGEMKNIAFRPDGIHVDSCVGCTTPSGRFRESHLHALRADHPDKKTPHKDFTWSDDGPSSKKMFESWLVEWLKRCGPPEVKAKLPREITSPNLTGASGPKSMQ
jgi:hypothetical protein